MSQLGSMGTPSSSTGDAQHVYQRCDSSSLRARIERILVAEPAASRSASVMIT